MQKKLVDKIQHPFIIKTLSKVGIEGTYLHIIKAIYDKPTASIILKGQKLQVFFLLLGTKQDVRFYLFYSTQYWKSQPQQSYKKKKIKDIQTGKEEVKWSLLADDMILYIEP